MTALLLLVTVIVVTWLCWWAKDEAPAPPGLWCPFDIRETGEGKTAPDAGAAPGRRRLRPAPPVRLPVPAKPAARSPSERPWKRSGS